METEKSLTQSTTYYAYTRPKRFVVIKRSAMFVEEQKSNYTLIDLKDNCQESMGNRAIIAMEYREGKYYYGIAICNNKDPYDKNFGKKLAKRRLDEGFASIDETSVEGLFSIYEKEKSITLDQPRKTKLILTRVLRKIEDNIDSGKYERKLEAHNKKLTEAV